MVPSRCRAPSCRVCCACRLPKTQSIGSTDGAHAGDERHWWRAQRCSAEDKAGATPAHAHACPPVGTGVIASSGGTWRRPHTSRQQQRQQRCTCSGVVVPGRCSSDTGFWPWSDVGVVWTVGRLECRAVVVSTVAAAASGAAARPRVSSVEAGRACATPCQRAVDARRAEAACGHGGGNDCNGCHGRGG